jgi:hypothetical protein
MREDHVAFELAVHEVSGIPYRLSVPLGHTMKNELRISKKCERAKVDSFLFQFWKAC